MNLNKENFVYEKVFQSWHTLIVYNYTGIYRKNTKLFDVQAVVHQSTEAENNKNMTL